MIIAGCLLAIAALNTLVVAIATRNGNRRERAIMSAPNVVRLDARRGGRGQIVDIRA